MTLDVRINNQSLRLLLNGKPRIGDQLNANGRTLEIPLQQVDALDNYIGQRLELWYAGKRWYVGEVKSRSFGADGNLSAQVRDPLFYLKNVKDWYFKNRTATQILAEVAAYCGIKVAGLANTGIVLPWLYYQNGEGSKVAIDSLARTYKAGGSKYLYRYDAEADGLKLYENVPPPMIWAFQVGVNLTGAGRTESIEETVSAVKLVNRETGKTVTKVNTQAYNQYGPLTHFAEVDKEDAPKMDSLAQDLLNNLSKVKVTMNAEGVNPDQVIPQLFSGDVIYVEEKNTRLIGAYHIRNVTHTFESDSLISLSFDIQEAPDIPVIQYENATEQPKEASSSGSNAGDTPAGEYSGDVKDLIEKYGL